MRLSDAHQEDLDISPPVDPSIAVDNLLVAQFIFLLLNNAEIRGVIDTITSKVVLILGRFSDERKAVLDAVRSHVRAHGLLPILFDFDAPTSRDVHETVGLLARMAYFVLADITDPRSIPQELLTIVEQLPSVPVQPLLQSGHSPWGMYSHMQRYPWVIDVCEYNDVADLLKLLSNGVIEQAMTRANEFVQAEAGG